MPRSRARQRRSSPSQREVRFYAPDPETVGRQVISAAAAVLQDDFSEAGLTKAVRDAHGTADQLQLRIIQSVSHPEYRPACRRGCHWCCLVQVTLRPPEVLNLAGYVREHFTCQEQTELLERVRALEEQVRGSNAATRPLLPCALLIDGECSVYPARPFACRAFNSMNAAVCERTLGHDTGEDAPVFAPPFEACYNVEAALAGGLAMLGLDLEPCELTRALRIALEDPDAGRKWLRGEPVFAPARAERGAGLHPIEFDPYS